MNKIDLHLHTDYSDGRLSPAELLKKCHGLGFKIISITDHDTIEGYLEAKPLADAYGITLIPGLEVSSSYNGTEVHILGYYFDETDPVLLSWLNYINESRIARAKKILKNLEKVGIRLDFDHIFAKTGKSGIVGRPHIARELMKIDKGLTVNDIFDKYLNENSTLFEPKITIPVDEIISVIKRGGGVTVLAHPHRLRNLSLIDRIIALGIDGIEVYCPKASKYFVNLFHNVANKTGLLVTGGSDYHGELYEEEDFGSFSVPEKCLERLNYYYDRLQRQSSCKQSRQI